MQVFTDLQQLPEFKRSVITIGTFDGVHTGHRAIIDKIISAAKAVAGVSIIITFHPHPRHIISPEFAVHYLTTLREKLRILESCGIDFVVVVPFSREFSEMEASDYAEQFLIKKFNPAIIVFGYDHKFGKDRMGDIHLLKEIGKKYAIAVEEIPAHVIDHLTVSSSKIRKFLTEGNITEANELLGYPYAITGVVVKGDQIGRTLGFPTANILPEDANKLIPANGVYIVDVAIGNKKEKYGGLLSIGNRPTFNKTEQRIEVNIFDFDATVYGESITIRLLKYIRPDKKFDSTEILIAAMHEDKKVALAFQQTTK